LTSARKPPPSRPRTRRAWRAARQAAAGSEAAASRFGRPATTDTSRGHQRRRSPRCE
jgi:hypothetical protein